MSNQENCCFASILKVIDVLQRNAENKDCLDTGCDKPFLGPSTDVVCFNTRPVTFYTCDNTPLTLSYQTQVNGDTVTRTTNVFRVEKVNGCCVTVSLLEPNPTAGDPLRPYVATGQTATINLKCIGALQCLPDIVLDCL